MQTNLRPLSLGEILDRTIQLYRSNFLLFAGIFSAYAGVAMVLGLVQVGLQEWIRSQPAFGLAAVGTGIYLVFEMLLLVILSAATVAAISRAVGWVNLGQPATIRGAYLSILPRLKTYLWLMVVTAFFICWPLLILGVLILLAVFLISGASSAFANPGSPESIAAFGSIALVFLLLIPWVVYAILMSLRYSLAVPACVIENLKALPALRRSIQLSENSRGRIFLLGLLIAVLEMALIGAVGLIVGIAMFVVVLMRSGHVPGQEMPVWILVLQQIFNFLVNTLLGPIWAIGITLFYYDQRIRKEGYDIEWMMHAAGLTPPEPAAALAASPSLESSPSAVPEQAAEPPQASNGETV